MVIKISWCLDLALVALDQSLVACGGLQVAYQFFMPTHTPNPVKVQHFLCVIFRFWGSLFISVASQVATTQWSVQLYCYRSQSRYFQDRSPCCCCVSELADLRNIALTALGAIKTWKTVFGSCRDAVSGERWQVGFAGESSYLTKPEQRGSR